jgi:hypothetical protein
MEEFMAAISVVLKDLPGTGALLIFIYFVNMQFTEVIKHAGAHLLASNEMMKSQAARIVVLEDKLVEVSKNGDALKLANDRIMELERRLDERRDPRRQV